MQVEKAIGITVGIAVVIAIEIAVETSIGIIIVKKIAKIEK